MQQEKIPVLVFKLLHQFLRDFARDSYDKYKTHIIPIIVVTM